jgi:hypothetical protein
MQPPFCCVTCHVKKIINKKLHNFQIYFTTRPTQFEDQIWSSTCVIPHPKISWVRHHFIKSKRFETEATLYENHTKFRQIPSGDSRVTNRRNKDKQKHPFHFYLAKERMISGGGCLKMRRSNAAPTPCNKMTITVSLLSCCSDWSECPYDNPGRQRHLYLLYNTGEYRSWIQSGGDYCEGDKAGRKLFI